MPDNAHDIDFDPAELLAYEAALEQQAEEDALIYGGPGHDTREAEALSSGAVIA
jgi:hypothetical protein